MSYNRPVLFVATVVRKFPRICRFLERIVQAANPGSIILLDYPINPRPRWTAARPHEILSDIIGRNREKYIGHLETFRLLTEKFLAIPVIRTQKIPAEEPNWANGWMPALDGVALYGFIVTHKPKIYLEIGSGNSTKFARKAIADFDLKTKIISIDPEPRDDIDKICDEIIRKPVENVDITFFDQLSANDILYIDNSHRSFMNSDVTALFVDILPRLQKGVLIEMHDITLPFDYPDEWSNRYYSEQYLLAASLLSEGQAYEIILPNMFITKDPELGAILKPLWAHPSMRTIETHGCSFWLVKN